MTHELRCLPEFFVGVLDGSKRFEVRVNDRGFKEGDLLVLNEWASGLESWHYTGRVCACRVLGVWDLPMLLRSLRMAGAEQVDPRLVIMSIERTSP